MLLLYLLLHIKTRERSTRYISLVLCSKCIISDLEIGKLCSHSLPLIVELGVSLHPVEDATQEAHAFCQWLHEYMGTYSLQSLNGNLHQV